MSADMNSAYIKALEAKNRQQHKHAAILLKIAALQLGLDLPWTGNEIEDWEEGVGTVDRWCRDPAWRLLDEGEPEEEDDCYWGFLRRDGRVFFDDNSSGEDPEFWRDKAMHEWGECINIYWCKTDDFCSEEDALQSLRSLLNATLPGF